MREISEIWKSAMVLWYIYVCIFGFNLSSVNAATDPNDVSALKNMYTSMNSAPQLTGWSQNSDDPCGQSWRGIKCSGQSVTEIDLSDLGLSGSIGYQLGNMQSVTIFDVSNNNLGGALPYGIPPKLKRLNLGRNNFNGGIPYSISMIPTLEYLNISHNQLQNQLDNIFTQLTSLKILDLSFNSLTGILPSSLSSLTSIKAMYLQNNQISGSIDVLANLPLDTLNIENNRFTGWVPETLKNINLDNNGNSWSSGPAPPPPPGTPPLTRSNRNRSSGGGSNNSSDGGGKSSGISGGAVAGIVISLLFVAGIVAFFVVRKKRSRKPSRDIEKLDNEPFAPLASNEVQEMKSVQSTPRFDTKTFEAPAAINLKPPPMERNKSFDDDEIAKKPIVVKKNITAPTNVTAYTVADLQMATESFNADNLLGEASFGRVYRAQFDDGKVLAVTKLDSVTLFCGRNAYENFMNVVINISRLHHPNLTELVGYCSEHEQYLLAYEFHKSGTLHDYLHLADEYSKPLIWNSRVKIALGTARALEYLHEVCSPSVVHKNVNSVNIALDAELNPHLSDSGLANYIPEADQYLGSTVNHGFNAPEILMSAQYSVKSDVYSFGVIMLELLTGRKPFDSSMPRSEQSLVQWASPQLHDIDALSKMVDPALEGLYPVKSLSRFADVIALCIQSEPEFRPPMSEVVQALVRLVQRANMSKRTVGAEGTSKKGDSADASDY